jgi:hypothetical protein
LVCLTRWTTPRYPGARVWVLQVCLHLPLGIIVTTFTYLHGCKRFRQGPVRIDERDPPERLGPRLGGAKDSSDPDGDARGFRTQPPVTLASRVGDVLRCSEHAEDVLAGELGQVGVESIGLGGDYDGMSEVPVGFEDVSRYPTLFAALLERGWSVTDCTKLAGQKHTEGDTRGGECCEVPRSIAVKKVLTAVGSTAACSFGRSGTRRRGQRAASARRQTQPPAVSAAVRRRAPLAGVAVRVHRLYGDLRNGNSGRTQRVRPRGIGLLSVIAVLGCSPADPLRATRTYGFRMTTVPLANGSGQSDGRTLHDGLIRITNRNSFARVADGRLRWRSCRGDS